MSNEGSMYYPDGTPVGRYSAIGNDVLEKIADIELTRAARKVLDRIMRDTIGYPDEQRWTKERVRRITYDEPIERLEEKTGLAEQEIKTALDNLKNRRIIKREREGDTITFNYKLEEWVSENTDFFENPISIPTMVCKI